MSGGGDLAEEGFGGAGEVALVFGTTSLGPVGVFGWRNKLV